MMRVGQEAVIAIPKENDPKSIRKGHANKNMVEAKDMTTIICEMDSMELCVWKEKHLQRA